MEGAALPQGGCEINFQQSSLLWMLIFPKTTPRQSKTSSKVSQSHFWTRRQLSGSHYTLIGLQTAISSTCAPRSRVSSMPAGPHSDVPFALAPNASWDSFDCEQIRLFAAAFITENNIQQMQRADASEQAEERDIGIKQKEPYYGSDQCQR